MEWARDKIRRPNQSDTSGENRRQPKKAQAKEEVGDNIVKWTGRSFPETQATAHNRQAWRELTRKSVMMCPRVPRWANGPRQGQDKGLCTSGKSLVTSALHQQLFTRLLACLCKHDKHHQFLGPTVHMLVCQLISICHTYRVSTSNTCSRPPPVLRWSHCRLADPSPFGSINMAGLCHEEKMIAAFSSCLSPRSTR